MSRRGGPFGRARFLRFDKPDSHFLGASVRIARVAAARISLLLTPVVLQSCHIRECCAPRDSLSLFAGIRVDSATFRSRGEFAIQLVPTDATGRTLVEEPWTVTGALESPVAGALPLSALAVLPADTMPVTISIDIDDSHSMTSNDPNRVRATGAQHFWQAVLGARPRNQVALLDFGGTLQSPGFVKTRLVQAHTTDPAELDAQLAMIQAQPGSGTPLYRSALEVIHWTDTAVALQSQRYLVIITDGYPYPPDSLPYQDSVVAAAANSGVRIFAVGVGPASDQGTQSVDSAVAVVRNLATRTGGIYAGVTNATQLGSALRALASEPSGERLLATFALASAPVRGAVVTGTVTIEGPLGRATAEWSFVAP